MTPGPELRNDYNWNIKDLNTGGIKNVLESNGDISWIVTGSRGGLLSVGE